jgi:hypothetical protein
MAMDCGDLAKANFVLCYMRNVFDTHRLAREAEEAAAAKEAEAQKLAPLADEHAKGLDPLNSEAAAAQK